MQNKTLLNKSRIIYDKSLFFVHSDNSHKQVYERKCQNTSKKDRIDRITEI